MVCLFDANITTEKINKRIKAPPGIKLNAATNILRVQVTVN
jgi:hypothetical protein